MSIIQWEGGIENNTLIFYKAMFVSVYASMILLMYFLAGINKIKNFSSTVKGFQSMIGINGFPKMWYNAIIIGVILLELIAPLLIILSLVTNAYHKYAYYSSIGLALFTVFATFIYHFPTKEGEYISFMKNLTATGGLLLLSTFFLDR